MGSPFDILIEQHRELEERFERLVSDADFEDARGEVAELLELLRLHSRLEERCFYPLLMQVEGRDRTLQEAEDHLTMRELMDELEDLPPGHPEWQARLFALEDLVVAHFQEEENAILPRLAKALDPLQLDEIRRDLSATREELLARTQAFHIPGRGPLLESLRWDG
ncbi:hemerythrin domain-containing protein [Pyxidicoccus fallax]|uniref:Hemerythrin domain-containing protein n=1 Tax=Pyxidicoccus fallax TaxID=394095 RepID=A0A848LBD4_9BACT|nr:hemerythrin domain-containing protein [Pyxidicoccus fallax]NMO14003.1 hemerythrin domain-containing protein [Pyxidicoccus fallax]NPC76665.1 hemerythrin domain-containing protein [Pyxidicoccus fallax]